VLAFRQHGRGGREWPQGEVHGHVPLSNHPGAAGGPCGGIGWAHGEDSSPTQPPQNPLGNSTRLNTFALGSYAETKSGTIPLLQPLKPTKFAMVADKFVRAGHNAFTDSQCRQPHIHSGASLPTSLSMPPPQSLKETGKSVLATGMCTRSLKFMVSSVVREGGASGLAGTQRWHLPHDQRAHRPRKSDAKHPGEAADGHNARF